jgi:hypothetical protein
MTKRSKKNLKKRKKRQLTKRLKQMSVKVTQEDTLWKKTYSYEEQTKMYQLALNKKYGRTVTAKERYINQHAIIIHHCNLCKREFYAKPLWLLTKENQRHLCGYNVVKRIKAGLS